MLSKVVAYTTAPGKRKKWQLEEKEDAGETNSTADSGSIDTDILQLQKLMEERKERKRNKRKQTSSPLRASHFPNTSHNNQTDTLRGETRNTQENKEEGSGGRGKEVESNRNADADLIHKAEEKEANQTAEDMCKSNESDISSSEDEDDKHKQTIPVPAAPSPSPPETRQKKRRRYDWMDSDDEDITESSSEEEVEQIILRNNASPTTSCASVPSYTPTSFSSFLQSSPPAIINSLDPRPSPICAFPAVPGIYSDVHCISLSNISWDGRLEDVKTWIESVDMDPPLRVLAIVRQPQSSTCSPTPPPPPPPLPPYLPSMAVGGSYVDWMGGYTQTGGTSLPGSWSTSAVFAAAALFNKTNHTGRAFVEFDSYEVQAHH